MLLRVLMIAVLCARTAAAQDFRVRPALLTNDGNYYPAVRLTVDVEKVRASDTSRPWELGWTLAVDAPFTWTAKDNPESLHVTADIGWDKSLKTIDRSLEVEEGPDPIDWGYVRLQGGVEAEAPQTFDVALTTVNAVVAYEHHERRIWFIPSVHSAFGGVACLRCGSSNEQDFFGKVDITGGWNIPLSHFHARGVVAQVYLRTRFRAFRVIGMPDSARVDVEEDGVGGSVEAAYVFRSGFLREAFVRWASGRKPVHTEQKRAWAAGVALAPGGKAR